MQEKKYKKIINNNAHILSDDSLRKPGNDNKKLKINLTLHQTMICNIKFIRFCKKHCHYNNERYLLLKRFVNRIESPKNSVCLQKTDEINIKYKFNIELKANRNLKF